jgi:hypothetical protein
MRSFSKIWRSAMFATASLGAMTGAAFAGPITAGDPALAPYTLQYGDFQVVSLAFANVGTNTNNYFVDSAPGQIRNDVGVGTSAGGNFYNNNVAGMDDPYNTEVSQFPGYFRTGNAISAPDPGGANQFTGDTANSWDVSTAALRTYLGGQNAVFYFNLNETGTDDTLTGTDILMWVKVTLSGLNGLTDTFYLAGNPFDPSGSANGKNLSIANGAPDETANYPDIPSGSTYDPADARWTYIHGNICVNGSTFLHYGNCGGSDPAGAHSVNQNLGANQAAFAGYNLQLDADINNPLFTTMQIEWAMAGMDNGYEQLFILAGGAPTREVPEPWSLAIFGVGLMGVGYGAARRRRKARTA